MHGYGIAQRLRQVSDDVLQVGESSLYPALQRLLLNGWVKAAWGASENNRRARYYTLTAAGRKQLASERAEFARIVGAIEKVLNMACARTFTHRIVFRWRRTELDHDQAEELEFHLALKEQPAGELSLYRWAISR